MENHTIDVGESSAPQKTDAMPPKRKRVTHTQMRVKKRNGSFETVDLNKIVKAIDRCCDELDAVDTLRVATRTISGLFDGASTQELDELSIQTAASFIAEEPEYSFLAARLLSNYIEKEVANQNIWSFSQSVEVGHKLGIINDTLLQFVLYVHLLGRVQQLCLLCNRRL